MNIRKTSFFIATASALSFIAVLAYNIVDRFNVRTASKNVQVSIEALSVLNKAIIELSLERSVMQVTLNLDSPIQTPFKKLLDEQRRKSDSGFEETIALVAGGDDFRRGGEFLDALRKRRASIADIRSTADRLLTVPLTDRNRDQLKSLPVSMKADITRFASLPLLLSPVNARVPSTVLTLKQIQEAAWKVREFGGRERTYLAIATATGRSIDKDTLSLMRKDHTIAVEAMSELSLLSGHVGLDDQVRQGIRTVSDVYFNSYERLRQSILAASAKSESYSVQFQDFFTESSDALGTAVNLSYLAGGIMADYMGQLRREATAGVVIFAVLFLLAVFLCGFQIYFTRARISNRILKLADQMRTLTQGDTDIDLEGLSSSDEIGEMTKSVEVFRQNGIRTRELEREAKEREERTAEERRALMNELASDFEQLLGASLSMIEQQTEELRKTADGLVEKSKTSGRRSLSVADASQNTSDSVQNVAKSGSELSSTIQKVSTNVSETTAAMRSVVGEVNDAANRINMLKQASEQIGSVVALITDIAGQTNLLALNATIEAARAGGAGKGFAVVASEVKNLSSQTEKATARIDKEIKTIQSQTGSAVESILKIEQSIQSTDEVISAIASTIEEQAAVTSQIADTMDNISDDAEKVTDEISCVCQAAAGSSGAAIKVMWSVMDLAEARQALRDGSQRFLSELRNG